MVKISNVEHGTGTDFLFERVVDKWYVVAETVHGTVYVHVSCFNDEAQAEHLARRVRAKGEINPAHWYFWRTIYGTEAYLEEEAEAAQWADMIRRGSAAEADAPDRIRELL